MDDSRGTDQRTVEGAGAPSTLPPEHAVPPAGPSAPDSSREVPQGPVRAGTTLGGRYEIGERIGAGGMATIYRAYDRTLERDVAVKVLHAHLAGDPELHARFRTEARHAASLSHPHIVAVYDQGIAELPYIVMELVDGPSLRDVLAEHGRLSANEALTVVEAVASALSRAHRAGVVHRDIKPENVLVDDHGTPKVADFGIARVMAGTSHTQTGALIGSVHYMAPELVDGREASAASDQYALGVVLYELLTGQRPFAGDTPMAVALRHTRDRVPAPSTQGADCDRAVDAVVARATDHDPAARYPDLAAFAVSLRDAVPEGPASIDVAEAGSDGGTLVIPADSRETVSLALEQEIAARRAPARTDRPADGDTPVATPAPPSAPARPAGQSPRPRPAPSSRSPRGRGRRARGRRRESVPPRRRWVRRVVVASFVTLLLLGAAAGGTWAWWNYYVAPITPVPQLVGMAQEDAFTVADAEGLGFSVSDERYDFDAVEGRVLEQDPSPGTELRRGEDVSVVVSLGRQPVDMPVVVGEQEADAVAALRGQRLEVETSYSHDDDVPAGVVLSQDPSADAPLREGDTVAMTVSLGIEQVDVPEVAGRTLEEAVTTIEQARLVPGEVTRVWSDEVPTEGVVIQQSIETGQAVDKGSSVDLVVSRGPLTISVPDLRGQPVEDARATLEARFLEVEVVVSPRPRLGPFVRGSVGLVEEQLPNSGEPIQRGDLVTLYTFGD